MRTATLSYWCGRAFQISVRADVQCRPLLPYQSRHTKKTTQGSCSRMLCVCAESGPHLDGTQGVDDFTLRFPSRRVFFILRKSSRRAFVIFPKSAILPRVVSQACKRFCFFTVYHPLNAAQTGARKDRVQLLFQSPVSILRYQHPLLAGREGAVIAGESLVVSGKGSGLVHIAPGHGFDDFVLSKAGMESGPAFTPSVISRLVPQKAKCRPSGDTAHQIPPAQARSVPPARMPPDAA